MNLYMHYVTGFAFGRLGATLGVEDFKTVAGWDKPEEVLALALGVQHATDYPSGAMRSESKFAADMAALADGSETTEELVKGVSSRLRAGAPSLRERALEEFSEVEAAVEAEPLGSWTTGAEVFARVSRRASPEVVAAHAQRIFDLCAARAKAHNDLLEEK